MEDFDTIVKSWASREGMLYDNIEEFLEFVSVVERTDLEGMTDVLDFACVEELLDGP